VSDEILNKIILCEITGKPYRIIKQELAFYRQQNIPLPTKHQDQRKAELLQKVMPKEFHLRNCDKCGKQMVSVYASSYPGKVYCEECYQKEVYG
jgi:formylmethanofuran dehydrogenase subunit E